jgi:hypothetical protein
LKVPSTLLKLTLILGKAKVLARVLSFMLNRISFAPVLYIMTFYKLILFKTGFLIF